MVLNKGQHPPFLHSFQKCICPMTDFYLASILSCCTLLLLSILTIKISWSWISLHWEAPRVSCPTCSRSQGPGTWLSQQSDEEPKAPQSMPFTVLSPEVCLPFWYPCSDWSWQLEGGPSHRLYHISNTRQAFKAGNHALQFYWGSLRLAGL